MLWPRVPTADIIPSMGLDWAHYSSPPCSSIPSSSPPPPPPPPVQMFSKSLLDHLKKPAHIWVLSESVKNQISWGKYSFKVYFMHLPVYFYQGQDPFKHNPERTHLSCSSFQYFYQGLDPFILKDLPWKHVFPFQCERHVCDELDESYLPATTSSSASSPPSSSSV